MSSSDFNPTSIDAVISAIKTEADSDRRDRMEFRDEVRNDLSAIKSLQRATNGRVRALEKWAWALTGAFFALTAPYASKVVAMLGQ